MYSKGYVVQLQVNASTIVTTTTIASTTITISSSLLYHYTT